MVLEENDCDSVFEPHATVSVAKNVWYYVG